jgi:hypothetical protein
MFASQRTLSTVKRQPTDWEKILANHVFDKTLIFNHPIKKWAKALNKDV